MNRFSILFFFLCAQCLAQGHWPHPNAHAHNDYVHRRPLREALENGFASVEADVHLQNGKLLVAHDRATADSPTLERLYLMPLDSMAKASTFIYPGNKTSLYLMIDIKTAGEATYLALKELLSHYPRLRCAADACAVRIFLSGERPRDLMVKEGYAGFGIDGRPEDAGNKLPVDLMPVISDTYKNWSTWKGQGPPNDRDLQRIRDLAQRVHAEEKKLRLWAIPDNELAWQELLKAGVDLISTDKLHELNSFLSRRGL